MSTFYNGNRYLSESEMATNAKYIWGYLAPLGWTLNAVAGMLGNMQTESSINPSIWQNLTEEPSNGYGLVQWTPSTKFVGWCVANDLDPEHMDSALKRLEYELENGLQWIETDTYPLTFAEFKTSTRSPSYLANAFLINYERPADQNQPARAEQAEKWYSLLSGEDVETGGGTNTGGATQTKRKRMSFLLLMLSTRK